MRAAFYQRDAGSPNLKILHGLAREGFSAVARATILLPVQVMNATLMPVVVAAADPAYNDRHVLDVLFDDLVVGYSLGRPHGDRLITWQDFDRIGLSRRDLRRQAASTLDYAMSSARIHGQPPALMLSFEGIESSALLCDDFWDSMEGSVPGSIVIGMPARDVLVITGSRSPSGLSKVRRAVDRMFFAGGRHLLTPNLLVRRRGTWDRF
jgi:uncharacterized protein YtpQ (UPF0354 family)